MNDYLIGLDILLDDAANAIAETALEIQANQQFINELKGLDPFATAYPEVVT